MSSFREQFKATPVSDLKKVVKQEDSQISSGSKKTDFLEVKDGLNKFRLFPKHQTEESFYHMRAVHWMTVEGDNGEDRRTTIPNARIHAKWSKDPIEEYINFVKKNLSAGDSDDADKIKKMVDWQGGMTMQTSWVCYAKKIIKDGADIFGVLEFKKTVRDGINDESIIEDEEESITVDPFTDPDDGKPLLITYNSKAKKAADYYKVQVSKTASVLSDEELEKFSKVTPLSELPMMKYDEAVFELALNGIQHFDSEHEIDLFENEEFQELIEEIRENFNSVKEEVKKSTPKSNTAAKAKKVEIEEDEELEEEDDEETGDSFSDMDRNDLKKHIAKHKMDIKIKTTMSEDDIRDLIRNYSEEEELEEEIEEEEDDEPMPEKTPATTAKKAKTLEEIKAELRAKQGKK